MNELNEKKYQDIINNLDWDKIHKEMLFSSLGYVLWVYPGGAISLQTSNTYHNPEAGEYPVLYLKTGIESHEDYFDGWGEWDEEKEMFITDDGRELTEREAIEEAIDSGDWTEYYNQWKNEIRESIEEDEEAERLNELDREAQKEYIQSLQNRESDE